MITIDLSKLVSMLLSRGLLAVHDVTMVIQMFNTTRVIVNGRVVKETSDPAEAINAARENRFPSSIHIPAVTRETGTQYTSASSCASARTRFPNAFLSLRDHQRGNDGFIVFSCASLGYKV